MIFNGIGGMEERVMPFSSVKKAIIIEVSVMHDKSTVPSSKF